MFSRIKLLQNRSDFTLKALADWPDFTLKALGQDFEDGVKFTRKEHRKRVLSH